MHLSFQRNIGKTDRVIRISIGVIMIVLALFDPWAWAGWINSVIGFLGAAMIIEGIMNY